MPLKFLVNGSETNRVNEGSSATIEFDLKDKSGAAVPDSSIETAEFWLTIKGKGDIINSRDAVDVKSKINAAGHFQMDLDPADNVIVSTARSLDFEAHLITISILTTIAANSITITEEMSFEVATLEKIPAS